MHWIQCTENGPRRVNHAAGALDDFIYSFGGYSNTEDYTRVTAIDINVLNIHTLKWYLLPKPKIIDPQYNLTPFSRYGHTIVVYKRKFYLWGGRNDHPVPCNRLFCFDPRSRQWSIVSVVGDFVPSPRDGHTACCINDRMYIFGGFEDDTQQFSNDLFYFDFIESSWHLNQTKIGDVIPQWRDFHSATELDGQMYVFGGRFDRIGPEQTTQNIYDDRLYVFNPDDASWSLITANGEIPCGRRSHSAFAHHGKLYIFGGYNNVMSLHFNDLYEFNPLTLLWHRIKPHGIPNPVPRRRQCCLVIDDRMYMFGGTSPISTSTFPNHSHEIQDQSNLIRQRSTGETSG
ncbi:unnamed protein product [Rotaria magnacalcarata]|uniref:Kelch domain-containing protein 3 n=1 Tax=Rotaria magnacalcarata TaxID=392030 RepID=A0A817A796_9BILA|nr:unnamed protein product [Rotaria magnacalcarata]